MAHFTARAEKIPGLITVGWIFKGTTMDEKTISLAWLEDGDANAMVDVTRGLAEASQTEGLTVRMRSFLTGLAEIGGYFRRRKTVDEPDVTEDDIENAAIVFAFPRVAMNAEARALLKKHLDLLQDKGVVDRLTFRPNLAEEAAPAPEAEAAPASNDDGAADPDPAPVGIEASEAVTESADDTFEAPGTAEESGEPAAHEPPLAELSSVVETPAEDTPAEETRAEGAGSDAGFPEDTPAGPAQETAPAEAAPDVEAPQDKTSGEAQDDSDTVKATGVEETSAAAAETDGAPDTAEKDATVEGGSGTPADDTLILTETAKVVASAVQPEPEKKRRSFFERL